MRRQPQVYHHSHNTFLVKVWVLAHGTKSWLGYFFLVSWHQACICLGLFCPWHDTEPASQYLFLLEALPHLASSCPNVPRDLHVVLGFLCIGLNENYQYHQGNQLEYLVLLNGEWQICRLFFLEKVPNF
ncbi:MAG: hypothetical protein RL536_12, partial [Candidatus Parcubacteria bacterium]